MALKYAFDNATILESMGWMGLPYRVRIAKTAALYRNKEAYIRRNHRNYRGPTVSTVKLFVKSLYTPPRGEGQSTYIDVICEIAKQKDTRKQREARQPWTWSKPTNNVRRNEVAKNHYTIWSPGYGGKEEKQSYNCIAIGRVGGIVLMVDGGGYYSHPRLYLRSPEGEVKVVVIDAKERPKGITGALTRLAPVNCLRGAFEGASISLDFDAEAFRVNGKLMPWRNVLKVYRGKLAAHNTKAKIQRST